MFSKAEVTASGLPGYTADSRPSGTAGDAMSCMRSQDMSRLALDKQHKHSPQCRVAETWRSLCSRESLKRRSTMDDQVHAFST